MRQTPRHRYQHAALRIVALLLVSVALFAAAQAQEEGTARFDHYSTGFPLLGAHARVDCASCHPRGVFKGTPSECGACHSRGGPVNATGKHARHIPSSDNCAECHNTSAWWPAPGLDHASVIGACFNCHNGRVAAGKPATHIPSSNACEDCHNNRRWTPAIYDHSGLTQPCSSCHNGVSATGKHPQHIVTAFECGSCHNFRAWIPASFSHSGLTQACSSCHNGSAATGKPGTHFITSRECDVCHTTTGWTTLTFSHTSAAYPGTHRAPLDCTNAACHGGNAEAVTWPYPAYAGSCAGCHAGDFRQGPHDETLSQLRDCSGSCHKEGVPRSGEHHVGDGEF